LAQIKKTDLGANDFKHLAPLRMLKSAVIEPGIQKLQQTDVLREPPEE